MCTAIVPQSSLNRFFNQLLHLFSLTEILARLEQEDCNLSEVEVDEVLRLVCHVGTEVSAHNAVPGWVVFLVELSLDEGGEASPHVLRFTRALHSILLHIFRHVGVLYYCFLFRHLETRQAEEIRFFIRRSPQEIKYIIARLRLTCTDKTTL